MTVTYFPTEIVALQEPAPVCDINKVSVIPCAEQCHSVLSQLCTAKEENGIKEFQAYHEEDYERHVTTEEIEWLKKCQHTISTDKPIFNSMLQKIETNVNLLLH